MRTAVYPLPAYALASAAADNGRHAGFDTAKLLSGIAIVVPTEIIPVVPIAVLIWSTLSSSPSSAFGGGGGAWGVLAVGLDGDAGCEVGV